MRHYPKLRHIFNGLAYDTEKAAPLAEYQEGQPDSPRMSTRFFHEILYRTNGGRFFLYGRGNPLSRWGSRQFSGILKHQDRIVAKEWTHVRVSPTGDGEGIEVLSQDAAREWMEKYAPEKYETVFGVVEEA